jgi:hypothetical protein
MARRRGDRAEDWTATDLAFLVSAPSEGLSMAEVASQLGKTYSAVRCQASRLKLRFPRRNQHGGQQRLWTFEEDTLLREVAGESSFRAIGEQLGRSERAVAHRASRLSIEGRPPEDRALKGSDHPWSQNPLRGPAHPRYRGSTHVSYRGEDWPEVRLLVLERDGYSCQTCELYIPSGNGLVVHHLIPYRLRPVNDLPWLLTLCVKHHLPRPEHFWLTIPEDVQEALRASRLC